MKWLVICGLSILGGILAYFVFKISPGNIFFYGLLLLCPLIHVFMMKDMDHGGKK